MKSSELGELPATTSELLGEDYRLQVNVAVNLYNAIQQLEIWRMRSPYTRVWNCQSSTNITANCKPTAYDTHGDGIDADGHDPIEALIILGREVANV